MNNEMGAVHFIQFLRPDGRQIPVEIDVPIEIAKLADELRADGWQFEIEHLRTGHVSMEVCKGEEERLLASEIVPNGPEVPGAVHHLVRNAHARWKSS